MGAKQGKHARDFDGESSPKKQAKRSSKRGSRSETPSRESSPPAIPTLEREPAAGFHESPRKKGSPSKKPGSPSKKPGSPSKGKSPARGARSSPRTPAKETTLEVETVGEQSTPVREQPLQQQELSPLSISISNHHPQATSTPAPNGVIATGMESPPHSPDGDTTDPSDDEAFTPTEQQQRNGHRSPSPTSSMVSGSTVSSFRRHQSDSSSLGRRSEPNFGRFYNTSYLEPTKSSYLQRASSTSSAASCKKSPHFHRPANFTFAQDTPEFLKSKKGSGMMAITQQRKVKVRRSSSPVSLRNTEAVRLSTFPAGKPPPPNEPVKIERDDWPGPACPAAVLPEILRERRRSRGEREDEDEEDMEDPQVLRELEEISKLKDKSGIGSVIYQELEQRKLHPKTHLDPWKASRAPSAKYEPRYRTRYQSPMFASPSRFVDRPRRSWDDSDIRGYRSLSTLANLPVPKPGYGPTYGISARAATLPLSGIYGARDFRYFDFGEGTDHSHEEDPDRQRSRHTSSSTLTEREGGRSRASSIFDGPATISLLKLQKSSWHTDAEPPMYPYETLRISKFNLPKDVDRNALEIHLTDSEFQDIFSMNRDQFYRMAEWKRNDIKRKHDLY